VPVDLLPKVPQFLHDLRRLSTVESVDSCAACGYAPLLSCVVGVYAYGPDSVGYFLQTPTSGFGIWVSLSGVPALCLQQVQQIVHDESAHTRLRVLWCCVYDSASNGCVDGFWLSGV